MEMIFKPKEYVGPLKFGMTVKEVREIFGEPERIIDHTDWKTPAFVEMYRKRGFCLGYGGNLNNGTLIHVDILPGTVVRDYTNEVLFPGCIHRLMSLYHIDEKKEFNRAEGTHLYKSYAGNFSVVVDDMSHQLIRFTAYLDIKKG